MNFRELGDSDPRREVCVMEGEGRGGGLGAQGGGQRVLESRPSCRRKLTKPNAAFGLQKVRLVALLEACLD